MNFKPTGKSAQNYDLNLTPLVDVVLLLVLFFMVTAQFAVLPGVKLLLPEVGPESRVPASERLEITLTKTGDLFFEAQPITLGNLPLHLERTGASGDEVVILISADEEVAYGLVVKIMDALKGSGFRRIVFAARPITETEPTP
ncbi:MAG: ExbD/TolR family protein [Candidatus Adiutrix sp.]